MPGLEAGFDREVRRHERRWYAFIICRDMDRRSFTRISKALADPRRYDILQQIAGCNCEASCSMLREKFPITAATLSHHLKELSNAGLIEMRRDSKYVYVRLRKPKWKQYVDELKKLGNR
jgi:ArsR family transcriptional regulator, arsenate/arsenite/antimonite-responsive transcriptional repressor